MAKRLKRSGTTVTFSISVDRETKKLLRDVADRSYAGNVSELIAQIAHQAARQQAAMELLQWHGRSPMADSECDAFEREIARELAAQTRTKKKRNKAA